jgi:hypothetical protein
MRASVAKAMRTGRRDPARPGATDMGRVGRRRATGGLHVLASSGETAPALCALVTERRAGSQARTAAPAQAIESHSTRCHLTVNRRLVGDEEWNEARWRWWDATASRAPGEEAGDELTNGRHRSLGTSRALCIPPAPALRGRSSCMLVGRDRAVKMHAACP